MTIINKNTESATRGSTRTIPFQPSGIICESCGSTLIVNFVDAIACSNHKSRRDMFRRKAKDLKIEAGYSEPIIDKDGIERRFYAGDNNSKLGNAFIDCSQVPGYEDQIKTSSGFVKINEKGSCPYGVPCADNGCYAFKDIKFKSNSSIHYLEDNTALLRQGHCQEYADYVVQRARGHLAVRFNTYGDFVNYGHFMATVDVARRLPDKEILAFTKAFDIVSDAVFSEGFTMPGNYTLLLSEWVGRWPVPAELSAMFPIAEYVNDASQVKDKKKICMGECTKCAYCIGLQPGDRVYLLDHQKKGSLIKRLFGGS